jgi:hypothetical protein
MLSQARSRAAQAGAELDLREGDMRDIYLDEPAALIYCPYRALLHLLEALYGGFAGEPFGDDSAEYVFVGRRPVTGPGPGAS